MIKEGDLVQLRNGSVCHVARMDARRRQATLLQPDGKITVYDLDTQPMPEVIGHPARDWRMIAVADKPKYGEVAKVVLYAGQNPAPRELIRYREWTFGAPRASGGALFVHPDVALARGDTLTLTHHTGAARTVRVNFAGTVADRTRVVAQKKQALIDAQPNAYTMLDGDE